jgi:hypothetical protein
MARRYDASTGGVMISTGDGCWVPFSDYADLTATLERCIKLAALSMERCDQDSQAYHENTTFWRWMLDGQTPMPKFVTIVRAAIESPDPR